MRQKKICMLGSFAVGKTSLVARYVHSLFSTRYHTTVGVKIDKKIVEVRGTKIKLMLWDIHGEDTRQTIRTSYLRGMSGYVLVADGTRRATLATIDSIHARVREQLGPLPFVVAFNKADLTDDWEVSSEDLELWQRRCNGVYATSAKSGENVDNMLHWLAERMISP